MQVLNSSDSISLPPAGKEMLINYLLHLADNALILGHRNSEWTGHGPVIEQDIAISNIALDLIGQARNFYQYAATLSGGACTEDILAYHRDAPNFRNCLLVEQPKGDWAYTILRQFFFSTYQYFLYAPMQQLPDRNIAGIAAKSFKEVAYHLRWSSEWVIRLGDGTLESRNRLQKALEQLWKFTGELVTSCGYEKSLGLEHKAIEPEAFKEMFYKKIKDILEEATLLMPGEAVIEMGGKEGNHTHYLHLLLVEMQSLQRAYPGCNW